MISFSLIKDKTKIEKHVLYSKIQTMLTKFLNAPINNSITISIQAEIQKILTDNGYSDLKFEITYESNSLNINFDDE